MSYQNTNIDRSAPAFDRIERTLSAQHCANVLHMINRRRLVNFQTQVHIPLHINNKTDIYLFASWIRANISAEEFNEAHRRVNACYNDPYDTTYNTRKGKGRPKGSKNKPKYGKEELKDIMPSPQQDKDLDETLKALGLDDDEPVPAPTLPTIKEASPKMGMDEDEIKAVMVAVMEQYGERLVFKDAFQRHEQQNITEFRNVNHCITNLQDSTTAIVKDLLSVHEKIANIKDNRPTVVHITKQDEPNVIKDMGQQHKHFAELVLMMNSRLHNGNRLNIWMHGPAGSGKSYSCEMAAEALTVPFYCIGAITAPHEITGYLDAHGTYRETMFYKAFKNGGAFCLDEIDSSSPVALQTLNGALAGTLCGFPNGEMVRRHKDFCFIGTANTIGFGADATYSARYKQDGAQMDRYEFLDWPYDETIEDKMCSNKDWLAFIQKARKALQKLNIVGAMITPRAAMSGAAMLRAGLSWERVVKARVASRMTAAQWEMVRREMGAQ